MGAAAYNRGTLAIEAQIDREVEAARPRRLPATERAYLKGRAEAEAESASEIARLRSELERATRALRLEAAKLADERRRAAECVTKLEEFRESYRDKGAGPGHYAAIIAVLRARRTLGREVAS